MLFPSDYIKAWPVMKIGLHLLRLRCNSTWHIREQILMDYQFQCIDGHGLHLSRLFKNKCNSRIPASCLFSDNGFKESLGSNDMSILSDYYGINFIRNRSADNVKRAEEIVQYPSMAFVFQRSPAIPV